MFSTAGGTDAAEKAGRGEPASKEPIDLAFGTNPPVVSGTMFWLLMCYFSSARSD